MTKKRFVLQDLDILCRVLDNGKPINGIENVHLLNKFYEENEQLKQRNNRQAKQLDRLYNLIEEKDWRTLTDILDDFKRCEEQLQKEWGTYGDVE